MLWHGEQPIGICVFVSPPVSLAARNRFFGRSGRWDRTAIRVLNARLTLLQRVVLHPTYRGAGIAVAFVHRSCQLAPYDWIETLTQMGNINPFFEKAGFTRVEVSTRKRSTHASHSALYGARHGCGLVTRQTHAKSEHANPIYYILDNRACNRRHANRASDNIQR